MCMACFLGCGFRPSMLLKPWAEKTQLGNQWDKMSSSIKQIDGERVYE
jgi:hypothetical protein